MVPAADDDDDSEEDVQNEKGFIGQAAEIKVAEDEHGGGEHSGDDAPQPIGQFGLGRVASRALICKQQGDAMNNCLDGKDAGDPTMQEHVSGVGPISNPEEEAVASGQENEKGEESECDMAGAVANIRESFFSRSIVPGMGLRTGVIDRAQDEVETEE